MIIKNLFIIVKERKEIFVETRGQTWKGERHIAALVFKIQNGNNTEWSSMFYTLLQPFHHSDLLTEEGSSNVRTS